MPRAEEFIYPTNHDRKKELAGALREYPELKDMRMSVNWPLDEQSRQLFKILNGIGGESKLSAENIAVIRKILEEDDHIKFRVVANIISTWPEAVRSASPEEVGAIIEKLEEIAKGLEDANANEYLSVEKEVMAAEAARILKDERISAVPYGTIIPEGNAYHNKNMQEWLLGSRKAIFATPHAKEVAERLVGVQEALRSVRKRHPDAFGLIVLGSTVKGYAGKDSDLDFVLLTNNPSIQEDFNKELLGRGITPCEAVASYATESGEYGETLWGEQWVGPEDMFRGLYIGDRDVLRSYQRSIIQNVDEAKWESIRRRIAKHEASMIKTIKRYGVPNYEARKIELVAMLTRVPPSLKEARKVVLGEG